MFGAPGAPGAVSTNGTPDGATGSVTSRNTAARPCAASAANPNSNACARGRVDTSAEDALDERVTRVDQQVRVADARGDPRGTTRRDQRHARQRRTGAHVGSEHGPEPPRVEA